MFMMLLQYLEKKIATHWKNHSKYIRIFFPNGNLSNKIINEAVLLRAFRQPGCFHWFGRPDHSLHIHGYPGNLLSQGSTNDKQVCSRCEKVSVDYLVATIECKAKKMF